MFSRRSHVDRQPNAIALAIERVRADGLVGGGHAATGPLLDLTLSNPTQAKIAYPEQRILGALGRRAALLYEPDPLGHSLAREALAADWQKRGLPISADRIALCSSTSEAYTFLFKLLCDPGDELLVPRPSYPLFEHLARFDDVRLRAYRLAYDGAWHIDFDSLERARTARTRGVIVVSPNNPTGSYLKREELERLARLGLPIVSDEVFSSYPLGAERGRVESALEADDCLVFALNGLSKLAGLPQLKLAWTTLGGPAALVDEAISRLELMLDAYLSPATPVQLALPELLACGAQVRAAIKERAHGNLRKLRAMLDDSPASVLDVEGGWYAVVRPPATRPEQEWVLALLELDRVLVQPGFFYDFETEPVLVLSLLTPEAEFSEGVRRLRARLE